MNRSKKQVWKLAVLIFLAFGMLAGCGTGAAKGYTTIEPEQLQSMIKQGEPMTIVDLREPELYAKGHIPGAINIPFETFQDKMNQLTTDQNVVFACHTGPMGDVTSKLLIEKGFTKVNNLNGGMAGWNGDLTK